jgi:hypothetical protein
MKLSVELLKSVGYTDNNTIRAIMAAAERAEAEHVAALRAVSAASNRLPSPIAACAGDPAKLALFNQARGFIRHLTAGAYDIGADMTKPIDVYRLDTSFKAANASVTDRIAAKENLARLGLLA